MFVAIFAFRNYTFPLTYSATWVQLRASRAKIKKLQQFTVLVSIDTFEAVQKERGAYFGAQFLRGNEWEIATNCNRA